MKKVWLNICILVISLIITYSIFAMLSYLSELPTERPSIKPEPSKPIGMSLSGFISWKQGLGYQHQKTEQIDSYSGFTRYHVYFRKSVRIGSTYPGDPIVFDTNDYRYEPWINSDGKIEHLSCKNVSDILLNHKINSQYNK